MKEENDFGAILSSLLSNKEVMAAVSSIAKGEETEKPKEMEAEGEPQATSGFSLSPELLSALPQVMSTLSGTGLLSSLKPPSSQGKAHGKDQKSKKALLYALKPFLCEKRCALIDTLVQLEGLFSLLGARSDKEKREGDT